MDEKHGHRLYWGWYVVLGAFLISGINCGVRYCFGIFVKPMSLEYGWSRSVISLGASLMTMCYGIGGIFSGYLLDRMAPRWIMIIGAALSAAGLILTPFVQSPWQYYLIYGLLFGLSSAWFGVVVCSTSVGKWFVRKRGMAIGIASVGIGLGTMILAPILGFLAREDWKQGFIFSGALVFLGVVFLAQLLMRKTSPEAYGYRLTAAGDYSEAGLAFAPTPRSASQRPMPKAKPPLSPATVLRDSRFWILALCYSLAIMAQMSVFVHQVAYAIDRGIHPIAAASALGFIGVASILGRFFFGWLSDRLSDAKGAASIGFAAMALGMILLMRADSAALLFVYALFFGFGYGSLAPMMPFLLADRFGISVLGTTYGILTFFATGIGGAAGPLLCGVLYDRFGSYRLAWQINLAALVLITLLILILKPRVRPRGG